MGQATRIVTVQGRNFPTVVKQGKFAVLPLGSIEYHGPHAPLGTDSILAEGFSNKLTDMDAVIYPPVFYSACPGKTADYPGTISISPAVYTEYLLEIMRGIAKSGFSHILVLNAHDGNMGVSRTVAEKLTVEFDASILIINWWQLVPITATTEWGLFTTSGRGHGGPYETSAVMAFCPDSVQITGSDEPLETPALLSALPYVLVESRPQGWNGYTGSIRESSQQAGERIVEEAAKNLQTLIAGWLAGASRD